MYVYGPFAWSLKGICWIASMWIEISFFELNSKPLVLPAFLFECKFVHVLQFAPFFQAFEARFKAWIVKHFFRNHLILAHIHPSNELPCLWTTFDSDKISYHKSIWTPWARLGGGNGISPASKRFRIKIEFLFSELYWSILIYVTFQIVHNAPTGISSSQCNRAWNLMVIQIQW